MIVITSEAIEMIRPVQIPYRPMAVYHLGGGFLYHGLLPSLSECFTTVSTPFRFYLRPSPRRRPRSCAVLRPLGVKLSVNLIHHSVKKNIVYVRH